VKISAHTAALKVKKLRHPAMKISLPLLASRRATQSRTARSSGQATSCSRRAAPRSDCHSWKAYPKID
jgi:hypothetical protein